MFRLPSILTVGERTSVKTVASALLLVAILLWACNDAPDSRGAGAWQQPVENSIVRTLKTDSSYQPRHALVIGNSKYRELTALKNPVNDAKDLAATLRHVGFEVLLRLDVPDRQEFERVVLEFTNRLRTTKGIAVVYYAGHAVEHEGRNYLIPTAVSFPGEELAPHLTVPFDFVLDSITGSGAELRIFLLDACRDSPFDGATRSSRGLGGLASVTASASGTWIGYSTAPGKRSIDGSGENSPYAESLIRHMTVPGLELEEFYKLVVAEVSSKTEERQIPWSSSSMTGRFQWLPRDLPATTVDLSPMKTNQPHTQAGESGVEVVLPPEAGYAFVTTDGDVTDGDRTIGTGINLKLQAGREYAVECKTNDGLTATKAIKLAEGDTLRMACRKERPITFAVSCGPDGGDCVSSLVFAGERLPLTDWGKARTFPAGKHLFQSGFPGYELAGAIVDAVTLTAAEVGQGIDILPAFENDTVRVTLLLESGF